MAADGMGDRVAIGAQAGGVTMSELVSRARRAGAALAACHGERVAFVDVNSEALPIALFGAALANKKYGRITVNIQCDGDLNYAPGVLWTAAHHKIPLLSVMHNNRGYHQERMFLQDMASRAGRGIENTHVGVALDDPNINYAMLAKAYGMYSSGPIENPKDLGPALKEALAVVKKGEPALVTCALDGSCTAQEPLDHRLSERSTAATRRSAAA